MRFAKTFCWILTLILPALQAEAAIISGTFTDWEEQDGRMTIGDGVNHVTMAWSIALFAGSGWFYGSNFTDDTDVAIATGITQIGQISDASEFDFTTDSVEAEDAELDPDGVGDFVVWRNVDTGYFGVLRIDDITSVVRPGGTRDNYLDGTWWFQTDGSGDFSAVPLPGGLVFLASALGAAGFRRRPAGRARDAI